MKKFVPLLAILFTVLLLLPLGAYDGSFTGLEEDWSPGKGEEYLAFNFAALLTAQSKPAILSGQPDPPSYYDSERAILDYRTHLFNIYIDGGMRNDEKYSEQEPYLGGRYLYNYDSYVKVSLDDFTLKAGQGPHRDIVDSPYSLFVSSKDIPVLHTEIDYEGDFFFYKNRWVNMTSNSSTIYYGTDNLTDPTPAYPDGRTASELEETYWLDKGMNFKVYGFDFGDWRFGFEDVVVYLDRSFDPAYFFNPLPQYFLQLITTEGGNPWVEAGNTKSMMGFFADIEKDEWGGNAQILIDDLNPSILPFTPDRSFKSRVAWSLGGWKSFDFGVLGFHHAGATKYTFSSTRTIESSSDWGATGYVDVPYSILPYDYCYYPVTEYELKDGDPMPLDYTDSYAGYKYGENNLAFLVDYETTVFKDDPKEFRLYSYFEYVMNGSKSPANPWHEYDSTRNPDIEDAGWVMFSGAPIEHILRVNANMRKRVGDFTFLVEMMVGYVFNGAELISVDPNYEDYSTVGWDEPKIYVPQNGNHYAVFQLTLGCNYTWRLK